MNLVLKKRFIFLVCLGLALLIVSPLAGQGRILRDGDVRYTVELYVTANYPVMLAFAPDDRLFYTEKTTGNVRVVSADGQLQRAPVITLATDALVERGMLGIALDPGYEENSFIWVMHTAQATARDWPANNLVRFHEQDGVGSDPEIMLSFPIETGGLIHNGGNVRFDADGYLYLSLGDYTVPALSQDLAAPQGAIHRFEVTDDGLIPPTDNPFPDNSIYAYGFRNPFDFTVDPLTGRIFATENGDNCDDEVNLVLPGFNYGWGPGYVCGGTAPGVDPVRYLPPIINITPAEAPTGIIIYDHEAVPDWYGNLFFCTWNNGLLRRVVLNDARTAVVEIHEMDTGDMPCRIGLTVGPEGGLYFTSVGDNTGAIYRLLPIDSS